jgi:ATP adenylyltransferase
MEHLWAPWRMPYIEDDSEAKECLFCQLVQEEDGPTNLILHREQLSYVVLNRFPYTNGHMMIVPFEHVPSLEMLSPESRAEMMELASHAIGQLRAAYGAESFNLGINIGEAAGAGILDHVHIHVVPRWAGDTNFMATTAGTRVLPEALEITYNRLREVWNE